MKKISIVIIFLVSVLLILSSCGKKHSNYLEISKDLSVEPIVIEQIVPIEDFDSYKFSFSVPQKGRFKLRVFDATEYITIETFPTAKANFYSSGKKLIYEDVEVHEGMLEGFDFEIGEYYAVITFPETEKTIEQANFSWAFSPETGLAVALEENVLACAQVNAEKESIYSFKLEKDSLVEIFCTEAVIPEYDVDFVVYGIENATYAEADIHFTEWISRKFFLTKGNYAIIVKNGSGISQCKYTVLKEYDKAVTKKEKVNAPAVLGFNNICFFDKTVKFKADGTDKFLVLNPVGINTYYDSVESVKYSIYDSNNKEIEKGTAEGKTRIPLSKLNGEYRVVVSTESCCSVEVEVV